MTLGLLKGRKVSVGTRADEWVSACDAGVYGIDFKGVNSAEAGAEQPFPTCHCVWHPELAQKLN